MDIQHVIRRLRTSWHSRPPLDDLEALDRLERRLGAPLPADYKQFLRFFSNGGEGKLPGGYLALLSAEETMQDSYRLGESLPGLWMFGQDGDEAFAFDTTRHRDEARYPVIRVPLGSLQSESCDEEADEFADFLAGLLASDAEAALAGRPRATKSKLDDLLGVLRWSLHVVPPLDGFEPLDLLETRLGSSLPADYKFFLQFFSNGGEGNLPGGHLRLLSADEIHPGRIFIASRNTSQAYGCSGKSETTCSRSTPRDAAMAPGIRS